MIFRPYKSTFFYLTMFLCNNNYETFHVPWFYRFRRSARTFKYFFITRSLPYRHANVSWNRAPGSRYYQLNANCNYRIATSPFYLFLYALCHPSLNLSRTHYVFTFSFVHCRVPAFSASALKRWGECFNHTLI